MSGQNNPPHSLLSIVSSLAERVPFAMGKSVLQMHSVPTSLGWERTKIGIRHLNDELPSNRLAARKLLTLFEEHIRVGEKLVRNYGIQGIPGKDKFVDAISRAISTIEIPESEFSEVYPLSIVDEDSLKELDGLPPILTSIFENAGLLFFQFCSVRSFRVRVELDKNDFVGSNSEIIEKYSEIIGILSSRRQCYDTVVFHPHDETFELRLDAPEGISVDQQRRAIKQVSEAFDAIANKYCGYGPLGGSPFNYHQIIGNLYRQKGEGSVFQLGFTAMTDDTSSNNGARLMRRRGKDLRTDGFHVGGKSAVKELDPYTIGVVWTRPGQPSNPKLVVPGTMNMLYKSPVLFPEVIVRDCLTDADYSFVSGKIQQYRS